MKQLDPLHVFVGGAKCRTCVYFISVNHFQCTEYINLFLRITPKWSRRNWRKGVHKVTQCITITLPLNDNLPLYSTKILLQEVSKLYFLSKYIVAISLSSINTRSFTLGDLFNGSILFGSVYLRVSIWSYSKSHSILFFIHWFLLIVCSFTLLTLARIIFKFQRATSQTE